MTNSINKVALVTGGSRGLGKDMVKQLAKKGFDIIFTHNNSENEAATVVYHTITAKLLSSCDSDVGSKMAVMRR